MNDETINDTVDNHNMSHSMQRKNESLLSFEKHELSALECRSLLSNDLKNIQNFDLSSYKYDNDNKYSESDRSVSNFELFQIFL
jgi:hypothetical protein